MDPIKVDPNVRKVSAVVALRQLILLASGAAIALGASHLGNELSGLALTVGPAVGLFTFVYGQVRTWQGERQKRIMAQHLPDTIAQIKDK